MKFREVPNTERGNWLEWRQRGIGSSDACIIMGVSRFKTIEELKVDKLGPTQEDTRNEYIKNRGNKIEILVRDYLSQQVSTVFSPMNCESKTSPFLRASLDGITVKKDIITEIKLLSSQTPGKINKTSPGYVKFQEAKAGKVPEEYYPQIQHQLLVTGVDYCLFAGYRELRGDDVITNDNLAIVVVEPDKEYIQNMLEKEFKFWYDLEVERMKHG